MFKRNLFYLLFVVLIRLLVTNVSVAKELDPKEINDSIRRAVKQLKSLQNPATGQWKNSSYEQHYRGSVTALCTLALLNCGEKTTEPHVAKALKYLRTLNEPKKTYTLALHTMVFCAANNKQDTGLIRRNVRALERFQVTSGDYKGCWGYDSKFSRPDNSNAQFALLALYEADRFNETIKVSKNTWKLARDYWLASQNRDGSWGYKYKDVRGRSGSMTCAGIASLHITTNQLKDNKDLVNGNKVKCCGQSDDKYQQALEKGLKWMGTHFQNNSNPVATNRANQRSEVYRYYYFYALERVGRMTAQRFLYNDQKKNKKVQRRDWYREVVTYLIDHQNKFTVKNFYLWEGDKHGENSVDITTSMALLFLSKGRRPVVIAKLQYGDDNDWNNHRQDVSNITYYLEKKWERELTHQVIRLQGATVEDLLQSPVLYITGSKKFEITDQQAKVLREYVDQGGFILAENTCDGSETFQASFKAAMENQVFADINGKLMDLNFPNHPIYSAAEKIKDKRQRLLHGIQTGCRTGVVFCPRDKQQKKSLSCFWELSNFGKGKEYKYKNIDVQEIADASNSIGNNIMSFATHRNLKYKYENKTEATKPDQNNSARNTFHIAKLNHHGLADAAPLALTNLLDYVKASKRIPLRVNTEKRMIEIDSKEIFDYNLVFMHGKGSFKLNNQQRTQLRMYLRNGGMLFADAVNSSDAFAKSFRSEMKLIFPKTPLKRIDRNDSLLNRGKNSTSMGFDLQKVKRRDPTRAKGNVSGSKYHIGPPELEAIRIEGRYVVIFSKYDISCALENHQSLVSEGYTVDDAKKIGLNILLYSLQVE